MKIKILVGSVLAIFILGIGLGTCFWLSRPQVIVLNDGTELKLLAVTYGQHHTLPKAKINPFDYLLQLSHLEKPARKLQGGTLATTNDSVCVWIEQKHEQNNWPNYQLLAYDTANTACVGNALMTYGNMNGRQGDEVVGIAFDAFPRRGGKIIFRVQSWNMQNGGQELNDAKFVVNNPAPHTTYAKWVPEKLPDSQQDGDLQVTLTEFGVDPNGFNMYGGQANPNDPRSKALHAAFRTEQGGIQVTNWMPVQVDTTDATGNHTRSRGMGNRPGGSDQGQAMTYQWGLWSDEPAWKLRVEMSRTSGFASDEMWSVSGVTMTNGSMNDVMGGGNNRKSKPFAETTLGENRLVIYPVIKLADDQARNFGNGMEAMFRIAVNPAANGSPMGMPVEGMRLTVVKVTDDQGRVIDFRRWGGMNGRMERFSMKDLGDAKTFNITVAYHRSRYVEFTVPPAKKG